MLLTGRPGRISRRRRDSPMEPTSGRDALGQLTLSRKNAPGHRLWTRGKGRSRQGVSDAPKIRPVRFVTSSGPPAREAAATQEQPLIAGGRTRGRHGKSLPRMDSDS